MTRRWHRGICAHFAVALASMIVPAAAGATTVTLGPPTLISAFGTPPGDVCGSPCVSKTLVDEAVPGGMVVAPGNGVITTWRLVGGLGTGASVALAVLGDGTGTGYTSRSLSGPSVSVIGSPNPANLPVRAGDHIGVTMKSGSGSAVVFYATPAGGSDRAFDPGFTSVPQTASSTTTAARVSQYNAALVLAPSVTGVSPATGLPAGGNDVIISGQYLDGATQVKFGGAAATAFTVDSATQIRATVPPGAEGATVDVTVTGPGGTSDVSSATKYAYATPAPPPGGGGAPPPTPTPPPDTTAPVLGSLAISPSAFLAANVGPSVAAKRRIGGLVTYKLSEPAGVSFDVQRATSGYTSKGKCVSRRPRTGKPKRCTILTSVRGSFARLGIAGYNAFKFMGRIGGKTLRPGNYRLRASAKDGAGNLGKTAVRPFSILEP